MAKAPEPKGVFQIGQFFAQLVQVPMFFGGTVHLQPRLLNACRCGIGLSPVSLQVAGGNGHAAAREQAQAAMMERIGADLASGPAAAVEDFVPGAAPAVLALLLPWALRGNGHSMLLAGADLVLALATLTAATVIVYRSQLLARMRMTCQSESSDRAAIWASVSPTKRSLVVVLVWAVAVIGGCAMSDAFGAGRNALIDRAADAALAVGALLWFIAFRAARRECKHLYAWLGTRNT